MATGVFTPYSTASPFFGALPTWVSSMDQERIRSYQIYEEMYWNNPETFKLVFRGTENKPIYVPSARIIVETINRFAGAAMTWVADPLLGEQGQRDAMLAEISKLFRREKFQTKFNGQKRYGIIRGDWMFHIVADGTKLPGSRISLKVVDPGSYFPTYESDIQDGGDPEKLVRVDLVDRYVTLSDGKELVRRQRYDKIVDDNGAVTIMSSLEVYEPSEWFKPDGKVLQVVNSPEALPSAITAIPVYPIKNFDDGSPFGSSEIRGLERLAAGINQSMSDEDVALALEGLGLYTTSSGGPVDDEGNDVDWMLGPGRVVENVENFRRVNGVSSVTPFQDHITSLFNFMKESVGASDAAIGKVDVQVAESGVALLLNMAPILSRASEKDDLISDTINQLFYDLVTMWYPAYEGMNFGEAVPIIAFGDKLPKNRKAIIDEVVQMMSTTPPMLSATTAREILKQEIGVEFAEDELTRLVQEKEAFGEADPFADRAAGEVGVIPEANPSAGSLNGQASGVA
jgi:hypothetical protein